MLPEYIFINVHFQGHDPSWEENTEAKNKRISETYQNFP
jgi:hypothetical protein